MFSMTFSEFSAHAAFRHTFLLRHPQIPVDAERAVVVERLRPWHEQELAGLGFQPNQLCLAEQVHEAGVAAVTAADGGTCLQCMDGLVSDVPGLALGIYVADCAAVYLLDPVTGAYGLLHSGKKGSEQGIITQALGLMQQRYACRAADVRVQVSPCIRPPVYEVDFLALIQRDALAAGIQPQHFQAAEECTASDLQRFYSYRLEKGRTGRMLALLGRV
jgi:polyphenol oxidase